MSSGTISSTNPSKDDKIYNSLISSVAVPGRFGQVVLTSSGAEVGASASEGGTAGTATGNLVMFKGTGGSFTAAGTGAGLPVTEQTLLAGEDLINNRMMTSPRYSYTHISAGLGTTVVKASAGLLHSIVLNGAATATNVTNVIDSSAGTTSAVIATPAATTATIPTTLIYDVSFGNGLVIEAKTAAGGDMTVSWM